MPLRVGDVPSPEGEDSEAVYAFPSRCTLTDAVYPSCCKCVTEDGSSHTAALRTRGIGFCLPDWGEAQGSCTWQGKYTGLWELALGEAPRPPHVPSLSWNPTLQSSAGDCCPSGVLNTKGNTLHGAWPLVSQVNVS